jgi:thiamine-phosphate pyrophosphorylase
MEVNRALKIAITPVEIFDTEADFIVTILQAGWDYVHLRHPGASLREMRNLIEAIPQRYHRQLRLHGHFELLNEFNLGGIHLNSRCPRPPQNYIGLISRTCHSIAELYDNLQLDFLTLSPIFDSVSKQGYHAAFSPDELTTIPEGKVIALGGVTPQRIDELSHYPFIGYAVLGYLFNAADINELKLRLKQFNLQ